MTGEPMKLEPGCTYVLEYPGMLSADQRQRMRELLDAEAERLGVRFLVLSDGMRIVRVREEPDDDNAAPGEA